MFSLKETAELLECSEPSLHKINTVHNNMKTLVPLVLSYISALEDRLQIVPNRGNVSFNVSFFSLVMTFVSVTNIISFVPPENITEDF